MTDTENWVVCQKCGAKNKPTAKYCTSCGAVIEEPISVCPNCGKPISAGEIFCGYCGSPLRSLAVQQGAETPRAGEGTSLPEDVEKKILRGAKLFSILGLISVLLMALGPYYYTNFGVITSLYPGTIITVSSFRALVFLIAGMIVGITAVTYIRASFSALSRHYFGFSRPTSLTVFLNLGMIVTAGFLGYVLASTELYANVTDGYDLLFIQIAVFGLIISVLVVIFLIIGFIGLFIGLWRLGEVLGGRPIKVSVILYLLLITGLLVSAFYLGVYPAIVTYDLYIIVFGSIIISILLFSGLDKVGKELSRASSGDNQW